MGHLATRMHMCRIRPGSGDAHPRPTKTN